MALPGHKIASGCVASRFAEESDAEDEPIMGPAFAETFLRVGLN